MYKLTDNLIPRCWFLMEVRRHYKIRIAFKIVNYYVICNDGRHKHFFFFLFEDLQDQ